MLPDEDEVLWFDKQWAGLYEYDEDKNIFQPPKNVDLPTTADHSNARVV
jgi:hypothetical protein